MKNESFDKIASALNTTFEHTSAVSAIDTALTAVEEGKKEIAEYVKKENITLKDKDYLEEKIKTLIEWTMGSLEKLKEDIKIGTSPRHYEALGLLSNSIMNQLQELRVLNKTICDMELLQGHLNNTPTEDENKNIELTSSQLLELVKSAQEKSTLNAIDADFEDIGEEDIDG